MNIITYLFYLKWHLQRLQVEFSGSTHQDGVEATIWERKGRKQIWAEARLMWYNVNEFFNLWPAQQGIWNNAHHRCYILGHIGQALTFLSFITRCELHQVKHAPGKVALWTWGQPWRNWQPKAVHWPQSLPWGVIWEALLHVYRNSQQDDYWKPFRIIFIVLF